VTNKPGWLTHPLLEAASFVPSHICVVTGDTVEKRKPPHSAPILTACQLAGRAADECLYIGDAQHDIEAGRRAGTKTMVALFGYIGRNDAPESWGADGLVSHPIDVLRWLYPIDGPARCDFHIPVSSLAAGDTSFSDSRT
jgi:phosphoglycolate phosphatase-like HAD superfamily hydrolase